ncbi:MAG: response regulator [Candidatus Paceibacterota bacterium]|jgi:CheY-like chemotaxis protein
MRRKILIVDDDEFLGHEVKLTLEETGQYEVHCEERSLRALESAIVWEPDLIILDLLMPGMIGTEVAEQLNSHPATRNIPIIFFTILASREEVEAHAGFIGGHPFLAKPSKIEEMVSCIEEVLGGPDRRAA